MMMMFGLLGSLLVQVVTNRRVEVAHFFENGMISLSVVAPLLLEKLRFFLAMVGCFLIVF
jgi:hypothetical protein